MAQYGIVCSVIFLVACANRSTPASDASSPPDGQIGPSFDAGPPPDCGELAGTDEVTVITRLPVVFHDSFGNLVCTREASESGMVTGPASAGGMFSAYNEHGVYTVAGLKAGDVIPVERQFPPPATNEQNVIVFFPLLAGATSYRFEPGESCQGYPHTTSPTTSVVNDRCKGSDNAVTLLGIASDAEGATVGYGWIEDVPLEETGDTLVNLEAWRSDTVQINLTAASAPQSTLVLADPIDDGVRYPCPYNQCGAALGGATTASVSVAGYVPEGIHYSLLRRGGLSDWYHLAMVVGGQPADLVFESYPPEVVFVSQSDEPRPTIAWTTATSPDEADILLIRHLWQRSEAPYERDWTLVFPPDTTSPVVLPELPAEVLSDWNLDPEPRTIAYLGNSEVDNYEEGKVKGFELLYTSPILWNYAPGFRAIVAAWGDYNLPNLQ
jgi:hypothetical protein